MFMCAYASDVRRDCLGDIGSNEMKHLVMRKFIILKFVNSFLKFLTSNLCVDVWFFG